MDRLALYAAALSTSLAGIRIWELFFRDKARLVVRVQVRPQDPWLPPVPEATIAATNHGRRPVIPVAVIGSPARWFGGWSEIARWDNSPDLGEGRSASLWVMQDRAEIPLNALRRVAVVDSTGRRWRARDIDRKRIDATMKAAGEPMLDREVVADAGRVGTLRLFAIEGDDPPFRILLQLRRPGADGVQEWMVLHQSEGAAREGFDRILRLRPEEFVNLERNQPKLGPSVMGRRVLPVR